MKTITRLLLMAAIVCAFYFATIGKSYFYELVSFFSDLFQLIADNYLRK